MHDDDGVSHTTQESKHCDVGLYCKTFLLKPCASHPPCIYLYGTSLCFVYGKWSWPWSEELAGAGGKGGCGVVDDGSSLVREDAFRKTL